MEHNDIVCLQHQFLLKNTTAQTSNVTRFIFVLQLGGETRLTKISGARELDISLGLLWKKDKCMISEARDYRRFGVPTAVL